MNWASETAKLFVQLEGREELGERNRSIGVQLEGREEQRTVMACKQGGRRHDAQQMA